MGVIVVLLLASVVGLVSAIIACALDTTVLGAMSTGGTAFTLVAALGMQILRYLAAENPQDQ